MRLKSTLLVSWLVLLWASSAAAGIHFQEPAAPGSWTYLEAPLQLWISEGADVLLDAPAGGLQYKGPYGWEPLAAVSLSGTGAWQQMDLRWYIPWVPPGPMSDAITLETSGQLAFLTEDSDGNRFVLVNSGTHFALETTDTLESWQWIRFREQERLLYEGEPIWPAQEMTTGAAALSEMCRRDPWQWRLSGTELQPGEVIAVELPFAEAQNERWCEVHVGGGWEVVAGWTYDGSVLPAADHGLQIPPHGGTLKGYLQAIPHPDGDTGWIEARCSGRSARAAAFIEQSWWQRGMDMAAGPGQFVLTQTGWAWAEPLAPPPVSDGRSGTSAVWHSRGFRFRDGNNPMDLQLNSGDAAARLVTGEGAVKLTWDGDVHLQWNSRYRQEQWQIDSWSFQSRGTAWAGQWLAAEGSRWKIEGNLEENPVAALQWACQNLRLSWRPLNRQWNVTGRFSEHSWSVGWQPEKLRLQWFMAGPLQWEVVRGTTSDRVQLRLGNSSQGVEAAWERGENAETQWNVSLFSDRSQWNLQLTEDYTQWSLETYGSLAGGVASVHWTWKNGEFGLLQFARLRWQVEAGPVSIRAGPDVAATGDRVYVDWLAGLQVDLTPSTSLYFESHSRRGSLWRLGVAVPIRGRDH